MSYVRRQRQDALAHALAQQPGPSHHETAPVPPVDSAAASSSSAASVASASSPLTMNDSSGQQWQRQQQQQQQHHHHHHHFQPQHSAQKEQQYQVKRAAVSPVRYSAAPVLSRPLSTHALHPSYSSHLHHHLPNQQQQQLPRLPQDALNIHTDSRLAHTQRALPQTGAASHPSSPLPPAVPSPSSSSPAARLDTSVSYSPFPRQSQATPTFHSLDNRVSPVSSLSPSPSALYFHERMAGQHQGQGASLSLRLQRSRELMAASREPEGGEKESEQKGSTADKDDTSHSHSPSDSVSMSAASGSTPNTSPIMPTSTTNNNNHQQQPQPASASKPVSNSSTPKPTPRTSSIDSAISSLSSISHPTTHSHKSSVDSPAITSADISNLISAANGSPEAVISHLVKEKQQAVSQNSQLWRLVEKQRRMVLALNKDLERAMEDKDRLKKKIKDLEKWKEDAIKAEADRNATETPNSRTEEGSKDDSSLAAKLPVQTPVSDSPPKSQPTPPSRRAPPAPLQLSGSQRLRPHIEVEHSNNQSSSSNSNAVASDSEYDSTAEENDLPTFERGRRKTREEDDRLRETLLAQKEKELSKSKSKSKSKGRSQSDKKAKNINPPEALQKEQAQQEARIGPPPATGFAGVGLPASPRASVSPPYAARQAGQSLASILGPVDGPKSLRSRLTKAPPMSPGLPQSPRPGDRPIGSPMPRMPREGHMNISTPLRNAFPAPFQASQSQQPTNPHIHQLVQHEKKGSATSTSTSTSTSTTIPTIDPAVQIDSSTPTAATTPKTIYRGLVSDEYPDLLLPPNSLPSILIQVSSSRLRPSRQSYMNLNSSSAAERGNPDEDPVFTLSVFARSSKLELWRVEKPIVALPQLDQQVKALCRFSGRIPDRSVFSGHSPAKVDERRAALNNYFEALLDTPMDDEAALVICRFLTADAIEPRDDEMSLASRGGNVNSSAGGSRDIKATIQVGNDGKPKMEGYLTKRGKNFGGWKSRYFVLHGPELKYYEHPGGTHLGTIRIQHAQIGKQSSQSKNGSSSQAENYDDNQYRHAFLILEPKKKDSSSLVRHVLCAESDEERDAWVDSLLSHVEQIEGETDDKDKETQMDKDGRDETTNKPRTPLNNSSANANATKKGTSKDSSDGPEAEGLRALSYDDVVAAEAPVRGVPQGYESTDSLATPQSHLDQAMPLTPSFKPISGPTNGVKIQDPSAWGNKPSTMSSVKEKKRSIWGFSRQAANDSVSSTSRQDSISGTATSGGGNGSASSLEHKETVRAVFGLPLAEAVEFCACPEPGADTTLPAVVYRCLQYLRARKAECEEGIFRLSGSNVVIKGLKERFNTEGDLDFLEGDVYYDVHAVASLFKQYLRELPITVLTKELHLDFIRVLDLDDKQKKIAAFHTLVHRLPKPNIALLKALSEFLINVVNNSDVNKMTVRNVGIVFAPTLNIPAPVFSLFLSDFDLIFGDTPPSFPQARGSSPSSPPGTAPGSGSGPGSPGSIVEVTVESPGLNPEDIRSPRHQMFSDLPCTPAYDQNSFHGQSNDANAYRLAKEHYDINAGFVPMHSHQHQYDPSTTPMNVNVSRDGQFGGLDGMLAPSGSSSQPTKSKRRESSLLFMSLGSRKTSLPKIRDEE
ncbi:hypothetical protein H101_04119 [Trichophyton interdigitale H6]|nr:hypothetical protein H101_04119 [Trichophyton interdigitale H6]